MPIRPAPIQVECPKCHWRGTFRPSSDVLLGGAKGGTCPKCGEQDLRIISAHSTSSKTTPARAPKKFL